MDAGAHDVRGGAALLVDGLAPGLDDLHAWQPALRDAGPDHTGDGLTDGQADRQTDRRVDLRDY
jgi:hypothetical protein